MLILPEVYILTEAKKPHKEYLSYWKTLGSVECWEGKTFFGPCILPSSQYIKA